MKAISKYLENFLIGKRIKILDKSKFPHQIISGIIKKFEWKEIDWESDIIQILVEMEHASAWIILRPDLEVEIDEPYGYPY